MLLVSAGKHPYEDNMSVLLAVLKFAIRTIETTLTVQKHFHMELLTSGAL
jgi:hypothetical protein